MAVNILYNINLTKKLLKINRSLTGDHVSIHMNYINGRTETCHIISMYILRFCYLCEIAVPEEGIRGDIYRKWFLVKAFINNICCRLILQSLYKEVSILNKYGFSSLLHNWYLSSFHTLNLYRKFNVQVFLLYV